MAKAQTARRGANFTNPGDLCIWQNDPPRGALARQRAFTPNDDLWRRLHDPAPLRGGEEGGRG